MILHSLPSYNQTLRFKSASVNSVTLKFPWWYSFPSFRFLSHAILRGGSRAERAVARCAGDGVGLGRGGVCKNACMQMRARRADGARECVRANNNERNAECAARSRDVRLFGAACSAMWNGAWNFGPFLCAIVQRALSGGARELQIARRRTHKSTVCVQCSISFATFAFDQSFGVQLDALRMSTKIFASTCVQSMWEEIKEKVDDVNAWSARFVETTFEY